MRLQLPSHACSHLRRHRVARSPRAHASGLLVGSLALLGLAAVPIGEVVTESIDATGRTGLPASSFPFSSAAYVRAATTSAPTAALSSDHTVSGTGTAATSGVQAAGGDAVAPAPPPEEAEPEPVAGEASSEQAAADEGSEEPAAEPVRWDRLADCESGDWDEHGQPLPGTARWDYGLEFAHDGYEQFEGGLNFEPGTWDAYRDAGMPDHAGNATREQQIVVGERVLAAQGWGAWPVCSEKIGLR